MTQLDSPEDVAVAAHRALAAAGLSDMIWGHASVRLPDRSGIVTKSSGWSLEEITTQRLVRVAWDGRRLAGDGTVHIEVPIHTQIMAARPDVEAVVHTHAPAVTAFASLGVPMRAISHDGVPFASQLPRFERTLRNVSSAAAAGGPAVWSDDDELAAKLELVWSPSRWKRVTGTSCGRGQLPREVFRRREVTGRSVRAVIRAAVRPR